jgi:hypothetical protein
MNTLLNTRGRRQKKKRCVETTLTSVGITRRNGRCWQSIGWRKRSILLTKSKLLVGQMLGPLLLNMDRNIVTVKTVVQVLSI